MLKIRNISYLPFKTKLKASKTSYFFNDSKRRKMKLCCSKKLSALLRRITSKHNGNFNCLNCLHSFKTKTKLESHKKVWQNKDFLML